MVSCVGAGQVYPLESTKSVDASGLSNGDACELKANNVRKSRREFIVVVFFIRFLIDASHSARCKSCGIIYTHHIDGWIVYRYPIRRGRPPRVIERVHDA